MFAQKKTENSNLSWTWSKSLSRTHTHTRARTAEARRPMSLPIKRAPSVARAKLNCLLGCKSVPNNFYLLSKQYFPSFYFLFFRLISFLWSGSALRERRGESVRLIRASFTSGSDRKISCHRRAARFAGEGPLRRPTATGCACLSACAAAYRCRTLGRVYGAFDCRTDTNLAPRSGGINQFDGGNMLAPASGSARPADY